MENEERRRASLLETKVPEAERTEPADEIVMAVVGFSVSLGYPKDCGVESAAVEHDGGGTSQEIHDSSGGTQR